VLELYFEDFLHFFFPDAFSWDLWGCRVGIRFPVESQAIGDIEYKVFSHVIT